MGIHVDKSYQDGQTYIIHQTLYHDLQIKCKKSAEFTVVYSLLTFRSDAVKIDRLSKVRAEVNTSADKCLSKHLHDCWTEERIVLQKVD